MSVTLNSRIGMKIRARLHGSSRMPWRTGRITNCRPFRNDPNIVTIRGPGGYHNVYLTTAKEIPTSSIKGINYRSFSAAFSRCSPVLSFKNLEEATNFEKRIWRELCDFHGV